MCPTFPGSSNSTCRRPSRPVEELLMRGPAVTQGLSHPEFAQVSALRGQTYDI